MLRDVIEIAIIVKQSHVVFHSNRGDHAVDRLPYRDALLAEAAVQLRRLHEGCLAHRKEKERIEALPGSAAIGVRAYALKRLGQNEAADAQVFVLFDEFL